MTDEEIEAQKAAAFKIMAAAAPMMARRLLDLADSADQEVAAFAASEALSRGLGHALDAADADAEFGVLDLRILAPEDRTRLREALRTILLLIGRTGGGRQGGERVN